MLSQYYIKTENRINFAKKYPNQGVKCSFCELIFPIHLIETHMATHISPQYMVPNTKANQLKKMTRPKLFLQEKQNDFMQSALKTVKKENIPKTQCVRKIKACPQNLIQLPSNQVSYKLTNQIEACSNEQSEIETNIEVHNVQKQFLEREEIQQNMIMDKQSFQVKKSTLQIYTAQKNTNKVTPLNYLNQTQTSWANSTKIQPKNWHLKKQNDSVNQTETQAYQIQQKKKSKLEELIPVFKGQNEKKCEVKIQKLKPPEVRSQSICTKSKKDSQLKRNSSFQLLAAFFGCKSAPKDLKDGQITVNINDTMSTASLWRTENVQALIGKNKHECVGCGGFYCSTCHSTIPPQYRPVSMISERDHQKTAQFYQNFVYRNEFINSPVHKQKFQQCKDCNQ